jgi:hypothetical protein
MTRYAQGMGQLEDAVDGKFQSVHLEHLLEEDWAEQLVPRPRAIARVCSCDADAGCEHVVAVAYAVADEVERSARVLLRWRGVARSDEAAEGSRDPWRGTELGKLEPGRSMPRHAVLKRLGSTGMQLGGDDLAIPLQVAYDALVASATLIS